MKDNSDLVSITPIFKYIGGKRWLANELKSLIANSEFDVYSEPFAGGLGSFTSVVGLLIEKGIERVELNDLNSSIVGTYQDAIKNSDDLIFELERIYNGYCDAVGDFEHFKELKKTKDKEAIRAYLSNAQSYFLGLRDSFNTLKRDKPSLLLSAHFITIQMLSFNGVYRENRAGDFNVGFCWEGKRYLPNLIERIKAFNGLNDLIDISLTNLDFRDIEYRQDRLYYLDPPYIEFNANNSKNNYNSNSFQLSDQEELIRDMAGFNFIYSNHNHSQITDFFDKYHKDDYISKVINRTNRISSKASGRGDLIEEILVHKKRAN